MSNTNQSSQSIGLPSDMSSELHHAAPAISDGTVSSPQTSSSSSGSGVVILPCSGTGAIILPVREDAQQAASSAQGADAILNNLLDHND